MAILVAVFIATYYIAVTYASNSSISLLHANEYYTDATFNAIQAYILKYNWKKPLYIIEAGEKSVQRELTRMDVMSSTYRCNMNTTMFMSSLSKSHSCKIVIWCTVKEQVQVIAWLAQHDLFQKHCTSLFITEGDEGLTYIRKLHVFQRSLRPDSLVFAMTTSLVNRYFLQDSTHQICQFVAQSSYPTSGIPCVEYEIFSQIWKSTKKLHSLSLSGYNLTVGTMHLPPAAVILETENVTSINGPDILVLKLFSQYMGFTINFEIIRTGGYGSMINGTWSGLVGAVQQKKVDFNTALLVITRDRLNAGDFTHSLFTTDISAVIRNPSTQPKTYQFITYTKPFLVKTWICLLLLACFSFVCLVLTIASENDFHSHSFSFLRGIVTDNSWTVVWILLQQDLINLPRIHSAQIVIFFILIYAMLVSKIYYSLLTASLAVKENTGIFKTIEELLDDGKYGIATEPGAVLEFMQNAKGGTLSRMMKKVAGDPTSIVAGDFHGLQKAYVSKFVYIAFASMTDDILKSNCSFGYIRKPIIKLSVHYFLSKKSPYVEAFNRMVLSCQSSGVMQQFLKRYMTTYNPETDCSVKGFTFPTIALHQVVGVIIVLICGLLLSLLAFAVEVVLGRHL